MKRKRYAEPQIVFALPQTVREYVDNLRRLLDAGQMVQARIGLAALVDEIIVTGRQDEQWWRYPILTIKGSLHGAIQLSKQKRRTLGSPGGIRTRDLMAENHVS